MLERTGFKMSFLKMGSQATETAQKQEYMREGTE